MRGIQVRRASPFIGILAGLMLLAGTLAAPVASAAPSSIPLPPFHACPAVGAAPSCQILLIVNPDRTVSVYGDPSVGPYDGGDDTLVGIRNDSSAPTDAVTVNGPGSGLGRLDGDGLCTFGVSGCPFGTTGYEGPNTTLVVDASIPDSAEIDFTGGLAPSSTTYFSLEGALASAQLTARQGHLAQNKYIALGDSFSSGEGAVSDYTILKSNPSFFQGTDVWADKNHVTNDCHRSNNAYPVKLADALGYDSSSSNFTFGACSGARLRDLWLPQTPDGASAPEQNAQMDLLPLTPDPSIALVTLTIGGNDAGFSDALAQCVKGRFAPGGACTTKSLTALVTAGIDELNNPTGIATPTGYVFPPSLGATLESIHYRAPNAKILLGGYPLLFGPQKVACQVQDRSTLFVNPFKYSINANAVATLNQLTDTFDDALKTIASSEFGKGVPVSFIDPRPAFEGHARCDYPNTGPWINGLFADQSQRPDPYNWSFHPNIAGQAAYETLFQAAI